MKLVKGEKYKLWELPNGSFFTTEDYPDGVYLKSEYMTNGSPDCYIHGTGEYFAGGVTQSELNEIDVIELVLEYEG